MTIKRSERTANFRYAIRNIVRAAEVLERENRKVTYLNIGDPQAFGFRPPRHVVEPVERMLRDGGFTGYAPSAGLPEAREAVASYASRLGVTTSSQEIIMTAGASEAADLVLSALLDEGDEVLLPAPGYPLYDALLNKLLATPRYYKLHEENGWLPSIDGLRPLINSRTRAIVLINPNNPTGSVTPDGLTHMLLSLASEHNLLAISDEVYRDLCFGDSPISASVIAKELAMPLITLESLSKTHMLSGWRVGWMRITGSEQIAELVTAIHRLASGRLCSPTPAQYAVKPALDVNQPFANDFLSEIRRRRDFSVGAVNRIKNLSCVEPEAAFYLMIKADDPKGRKDERFVLDLLQETGVLVVHGSGFGTDAKDGYFRLVYLADEEMLGDAFQKIDQFLNG